MDDDQSPDRVRLERAIVTRYPVRVHLSLILAACFAAGMIVSKLLLSAGIGSMLLRYPVALLAAYATFLLGIRLWLAYTGYGPRASAPANASKSSGSGFDIGNLGIPVIGRSGTAGDGSVLRGGGGRFGGGGASVQFADAAAGADAPAPAAGSVSGWSGKGGGGGGFDLGDDGLVVVALIALVSAVLGAGAYLVYIAPTIVSDAAFAALLSAGLVHSTRKIGAAGWAGSVIRDTWIPFAAVLLLSVVFAVTARHYHPEARTIYELIRML